MLRWNCARIFSWVCLGIFMAGCQGTAPPSIGESNSPESASPGDVHRHFPRRYASLEASQEIQNATGPAEDQGKGPGQAGDRYAHTPESDFLAVRHQPLSTFSIDVDTASYSKTRMYLLQENAWPPVDAVRIEELVNYFEYDYPGPEGESSFALHLEMAECPWNSNHHLARIAVMGRELENDRPDCNLVFLVDVSGSMASPQKLGLVKKCLRMLSSQLEGRDRVAIVVYASQEGLVLPSTSGDHRSEILDAVERLEAGGATNGGAGIRLAYQVARQNLIREGTNRIILCTDGDFNVGTTSTGELVRLAESEAKSGVFLTVAGFGMGNHNDAMLEEISNKANGTYAFLDGESEAQKVFVDQIDSTLVTIAKDVKLQVEFNPAQVAAYRLIGYENRLLAAHEFNDDRKDAGEVGAGHAVTALYELVLVGAESSLAIPPIDPLKYQWSTTAAHSETLEELLTVKLRYKNPAAEVSQLLTAVLPRGHRKFRQASVDFQFASAVAAFGLLLRRSEHAGDLQMESVHEIARGSLGRDHGGYRAEFLKLVQAAGRLPPPPRRVAKFSPAE